MMELEATASTNLEVAAIKGTIRVDNHQSKMPTKYVLVVGLEFRQSDKSHLARWFCVHLTSMRTHFSFCSPFRSPMMRCFAAAAIVTRDVELDNRCVDDGVGLLSRIRRCCRAC